ncbi:hypothetical protein Lgor_3009 [Fluoribacter gormanii]|uniref:Uncharacterized protein n=1 Tax=Fluoribacter gormanii TaxID=464 RepID=A0A377GNM4_9GAMM|nr:hypothetical protein Lgor_3009 [Fluoribacter gormanii]SIR07240.1 hypothetical protein SAMN05421777_10648 [Fluoribacter gormanii]STO26389.1 Uncharacterised protein [Fluoribacter gormanii]
MMFFNGSGLSLCLYPDAIARLAIVSSVNYSLDDKVIHNALIFIIRLLFLIEEHEFNQNVSSNKL